MFLLIKNNKFENNIVVFFWLDAMAKNNTYKDVIVMGCDMWLDDYRND